MREQRGVHQLHLLQRTKHEQRRCQENKKVLSGADMNLQRGEMIVCFLSGSILTDVNYFFSD